MVAGEANGMSRGPGLWQRVVLEMLERTPAVYVQDLLPVGYSRAQYSALLRAVSRLEELGRIEVTRYRCWAASYGCVVVGRIGANVQRDKVSRLSVDEVAKTHLINTYEPKVRVA